MISPGFQCISSNRGNEALIFAKNCAETGTPELRDYKRSNPGEAITSLSGGSHFDAYQQQKEGSDLLKRTVYAEVPPLAESMLTELGYSLKLALDAMQA